MTENHFKLYTLHPPKALQAIAPMSGHFTQYVSYSIPLQCPGQLQQKQRQKTKPETNNVITLLVVFLS